MNKYETTSLWNASALYSRGHKCQAEVIGSLPDGRDKFLYIFNAETEEEKIELGLLVSRIKREEMLVNLSQFAKSYQTLKNLKS